MNAKEVFFEAVRHFKERNADVLPQAQLQTGANERWFAREFAIAMNRHFGGSWAARDLQPYADCECSYADIAVFDGDDKPAALYETKVIYNDCGDNLIAKIVDRAHEQLTGRARLDSERRLGLLFTVYCAQGPASGVAEHKIQHFRDQVRTQARRRFKSDHDMRITDLSPLTEIRYAGANGLVPWHTQSWITWGAVID